MALDRKLSRDFWLHEASGWRDATEAEVAELQTTVVRVLQPIRSHFGVPVRITSWQTWSDGTPREGSHSHPGTVDFVVDGGLTREAWEWGRLYLVPSGYIGRWIYEPARTAAESRAQGGAGRRQGEHVHMAPRDAMLEVFGKGDIQVLEEHEEGVYELARSPVAIGTAALALLGFLAWTLAGRRELAPS